MDKDIEDFLRQAANVRMSPEESGRIREKIMRKMETQSVRANAEACPTDSMDSFDTSFIAQGKELKLTASETLRAEQSLHAFMDAHPVDMAATIRRREAPDFWTRIHSFFDRRFVVESAAVLILVGSGAGISYAAENALPGDALYAVKIHVNEPVAAALAFTPEAKATVNAKIASSRVQEAERLAVAGRLTTAASAELITDFERHVSLAKSNIAALQESGDDAAAMSLHAGMQGELRHHAAVLHEIANNQKNGDDHADIAALLNNVEGATNDIIAAALPLNAAPVAVKMALNAGGNESSSREEGNANRTMGIATMHMQQSDTSLGASLNSSEEHVNAFGLPVSLKLHTPAPDRSGHQGHKNKSGSGVATGSGAAAHVDASASSESSVSSSTAPSESPDHDNILNGITLPKVLH